MNNLLTQNAKMKKSGDRVFNFTLPAIDTCPNRGSCARGCYAMQGAYRWSNVYAKHKANYNATLSDEFIGEMIVTIRKKRAKRIRIHDAGDFYSRDYAIKWQVIADACPDVEFYAYTKMVALFKRDLNDTMPSNMTIIYSYGGKQDNMIAPDTDRHSQVFKHIDDLNRAGYVDASKDDSLALTPNKRVGLVYHGAKSKEWGE
jgi:hypothetical protein